MHYTWMYIVIDGNGEMANRETYRTKAEAQRLADKIGGTVRRCRY